MKRVSITAIIIFLIFAFNCILTEADERKVPQPPVPVGSSGGGFGKGVREKEPSGITVTELMEKIKRNERFVLLDIRTQDEFNQGHIKGALSIPYDEIETRYKELGCRCKEIIVYCLKGENSQLATEFLIKSGFHRAKSLIGGIEAWKKAGGEISRE